MKYYLKEDGKYKMRIIVKSKDLSLIVDKFNEANKTFVNEAKERKCSILYKKRYDSTK